MCARVKDQVLESLWTAEEEDQSYRVCEWDSVIAGELPARGGNVCGHGWAQLLHLAGRK